MPDWNPELYRRFEDERTRPSHDLLARVPADLQVRHAVDLGCGPGNSTELVAARFSTADVLGIDNSQAMLASARQRLPALRFAHADIASWQPAPGDPAPDLVFANAALQWVPGHDALLPRLFAALAPGGVLAVQMPDNLDEPSHRLMRDVAAQPPYAAHIGDAGAVRERPLPVGRYYDLLVPHAAQVDVWHTVYQHPMSGAVAIVDWLRSTGLRPFLGAFLGALAEPDRAGFLAAYGARIADAYPPRADGQRLLAFPRLFIIARRKPQ